MYVDSVSHVNPDDQYTSQQHDGNPQGTSHPQSMHCSMYVDSGFQVNPQDQYTNIPSYIDPCTLHPQSMHAPVYVDLRARINSHCDRYTNQPYDITLQGPSHPQNAHHSMYVDLVSHMNPDDQYTSQWHNGNPQGTSHPQSTYISTHIDSRFHANLQDQHANQPPYIDPSTSHPQSMHASMYVDLGAHVNSHDQYTNQSYDITPQDPSPPQNMHHLTYVNSVSHVNPDDQCTSQRHDADPQGASHPQSMYASTYDDSRPHANTHDQSANYSNVYNDHPDPEQLISVPQTAHHPPAHGLAHHHHVSNTYYHAPHPEMSYSSDWMHSSFDVQNASDGVKGEPSRRHNYLAPRDVEHSEGSSHSAVQSVLPPVLDAQPVTMPPPALTTLSPAPASLQSVSNSLTLAIFGPADLSKVKSAALFHMKCTIFINSFFLDAAMVGKMAKLCMDADVLHDNDLITWSKTSDGKSEVSKLCKALGTIKKNIQFLSHSVVLWGYALHYLLMEKPWKEVKEFVCGLIKGNRFLYGIINVQGMKVEVVFGNVTIQYFVRQLLFHDRKYINYLGQDQDIQYLLNFVGISFKWVLSELSSGVFKDQDFKMDNKTHQYSEELKMLFNAMPIEHCKALVKSIFTQGGVAI
ncbi:hypothetical protein F4604DRAFT_1934344 [Suillus subluteus]|nr:hypothetical protein F4604DRAFT_1934344 [Suillus subluteus]